MDQGLQRRSAQNKPWQLALWLVFRDQWSSFNEGSNDLERSIASNSIFRKQHRLAEFHEGWLRHAPN
jgi:hypothetical protein